MATLNTLEFKKVLKNEQQAKILV